MRPEMLVRTSRVRSIAFIVALAAVLIVLPAPAGHGSDVLEQPPKFVGMASNDFLDDAAVYEGAVGDPLAFRQIFWSLDNGWPNAWAPAELSALEARGITGYAEITMADFDDLLSGAYDDELAAFVQTIGGWLDEDAGRQIVLAPLPEANLRDFVWGGDPAGYKAGYERIRTAFLDAGLGRDQVRFVFAMHGTSSSGLSMADFYPGDDVVDIVGFSIINRNNPWHDYDSAFQRFLDEIKSSVTRAKPILVTQTASVVEGQDRAGWLDDMFTNLGADSQVIGIIYFNRAKTEGGKYNDYRVINGSWIDPAFVAGASSWTSSVGVDWLFDGRMDAWVTARAEALAGMPYFSDIAGSSFEGDIMWMAGEGITKGCNPPTNDRFCPDDGVTRGQMAAFLSRALDLPVVSGVDTFVDDDASVFEVDIERLAAAGITAGCNPPTNDRFCPDDGVTRGQMAAFLSRALDLPVVSGVDTFVDDDASVFEVDIERLAAAGITAGCNPPTNDRFCPDARVTRGQMAAFLARALTG